MADDEELDTLLNSALDDFDQPSPTPILTPEMPETVTQNKDSLLSPQEQFFQQLFDSELASEAAQEFETVFHQLAKDQPGLMSQFHSLSQAASSLASNPQSHEDFDQCLKETLSGLAKDATDLQSPPGGEEGLCRLLEGVTIEGTENPQGLVPVVQSILENLLSREILYPSLRDITGKFPAWLATHSLSLSTDERKRYEEQLRLMEEICRHFEREATEGSPGASGQGAGERASEGGTEGEREGETGFEHILQLMQQLQELGQPPQELTEMPRDLNLEALNLSGNQNPSEQCRVM